jgi:predicted Fe-Mo cluster-binding NifX family protein
MKIAVATDNGQDVGEHFGRCARFIIFDTERKVSETIENAGKDSGSGAGIVAAQCLVRKQVDAIIAGNCGPKAYQVLSRFGTKVITGVKGKIAEVVEGFQAGKLKEAKKANAPAHFGTK